VADITLNARAAIVDELLEHFEVAMAARTGSFLDLEVAALETADELVRAWAQRALQRLADSIGAEVVVGGQRYRRHASGLAKYHSLCGPLEVRRHTYRLIGIHNGPTVVPLERAAGLQNNATPALVQSTALAFANMPLRDYEEQMSAAHRHVPSRSTLERIGKGLGSALLADLPAIEHRVRAVEVVPSRAHSVSVGIDRTTAPMAEPTGYPSQRAQPPYVREPPPEVRVAYRMPYIATVAINDAQGDVLVSKRIAATPEEGAASLMERLAAEVQHIRNQRPELPIVVIQDGAPELWSLIDAWESDFGIPIAMKLIDRYHLNGRLAEAADAIEPDKYRRWRLLARWRDSLARSDLAIGRIASSFNKLVNHIYAKEDEKRWPYVEPTSFASLTGERQRIVEKHLTYLANNRHRMTYATARRNAYPEGSGVTEGACKSIVAARCKRSGQRWNPYGLSRCLLLRTLHLNGRLRASIETHLEDQRIAITTA